MDNTTSEEIIQDVGVIDTTEQESSDLEFTLYNTNEEFIMSQIADITGLTTAQVKMLINFVYAEPEGFEDEIIEPEISEIEGIEKINGSVIIKLG